MSGNVWEWVEDCWHDTYHGAPENGMAWVEVDGGDCKGRLIRGGAWGSPTVNMRSLMRGRYDGGLRSSDVGFRLAQDID